MHNHEDIDVALDIHHLLLLLLLLVVVVVQDNMDTVPYLVVVVVDVPYTVEVALFVAAY